VQLDQFVFLSADKQHTTGVSPARVAEVCAELGLRALSERHWVLDEPYKWLEVSAWSVRPGQPRSDRYDDPGDTVNVIRCQPRPYGPRATSIVLELAAALGWQVTDPKTWEPWRDPGLAPAGEWPRWLAPHGSTYRHVARLDADADGPAEAVDSITCLPDGRVLVGQHENLVGRLDKAEAQHWVSVRSGPKLVRTGLREDLGTPVRICSEGRRIAAGGGRRPLRIATLDDGEPIATATWSLGLGAAWLPDWPSALLATTRHPHDRSGPPIAPDEAAATELARLEQRDGQRLVVIDTQTAKIYPVGAHRFRQFYDRGLLTVTGDGATAFLNENGLRTAVSLDTGEVLWARSTPASLTATAPIAWAVAASACGRFVATGGDAAPEQPRVLDIRESTTGRVLAGFTGTALGGSGKVRSLAFHPSGWLAVGQSDGQARHVTPNGSTEWYRIDEPGSAITALAFTPDGTRLLAGGASGRLFSVDLLEPERRPPVTGSLAPPAERERRLGAIGHAS
jgi:hypothetical protein